MTRRLLCLCLPLAACLPELVQREGEHITVEHSAGLELCGGSVAYLDRIVPFYSAQLGLPTPAHVRYAWLTRADRQALLGDILDDVGGFSMGSLAMSSSAPILVHEIVHVLTFSTPLIPYFNEGISTVYETLELGLPPYQRLLATDPRPGMTATDSHDLDYVTAGQFTAYLLARHGHDPLYRLNARLYPPYTLDRIARVFGDVYGLDFDAEVDRFMRGDLECADFAFELSPAICTAPVAPWTGDAWVLAGVHDCADPDVVGGSGESGHTTPFRVAGLEIPTTGDYTLAFFGDDELHANVDPCFGCPGEVPGYPLSAGDTRRETLPAGRYQVRITGDATRSPSYALTIRPH